MPIQVNTSGSSGQWSMTNSPPMLRGALIPRSEVCYLPHERILQDLLTYLVAENHKLEALEFHAVDSGYAGLQMARISNLRCSYMREAVKRLSQAADCPHRCEKVRRVPGCCWKSIADL